MRLGCPRLNCAEVESEKKRLWVVLYEKMPPLEKFEKISHGHYMGYITVCDFLIYELLSYLEKFFDCIPKKC